MLTETIPVLETPQNDNDDVGASSQTRELYRKGLSLSPKTRRSSPCNDPHKQKGKTQSLPQSLPTRPRSKLSATVSTHNSLIHRLRTDGATLQDILDGAVTQEAGHTSIAPATTPSPQCESLSASEQSGGATVDPTQTSEVGVATKVESPERSLGTYRLITKGAPHSMSRRLCRYQGERESASCRTSGRTPTFQGMAIYLKRAFAF